MIEIGLNKVNKNYGSKTVVKDISFEIKTNEKVSLIGPNGSGKTTILKIIAGIESINSGLVSIRRGAKIGYLSQTNQDIADKKVNDIIYDSLVDILDMRDRLTNYEEKMHTLTGNKLEKLIISYTNFQEEFINRGGYEIDTKINKVLAIFKIDKNMLERDFNSLSGGEKTIVSLASLILGEYDILLLDEPTNHLDIEATEWLENFLINYKGTIVLVSHDRYFLDSVSTKTILVDGEAIDIYHGNYTYFLEENEKRILQEFKDYNNQEKQIKSMKEAIKKLREWGKLGDNEKFFKRVSCIEKRLEKMEKLDKPGSKKSIPLDLRINDRSGKDVLEIKNFSLSYGDNIIFNRASMDLYFKERVCIIGSNGSGKSTLIKSILSNKEGIRLGSNISIGYIPQEIVFEDDNRTILEEAKRHYIGIEEHLRSALYKFMFIGENVHKKLKTLSGGESVRLKLFLLMQLNCNLLILDEPTNHIDIDTREILESALEEYQGTILFISHDRYFINKIATRIVAIKENKLISHDGNYDYYKKSKQN